MEELRIEYLRPEDLKPYENNARAHTETDIAAICESIKDVGFSDPIGVWGPENIIVEGHGRLLAAKKLGLEKVPVIRLDHMTDEQRREYALTHNKTAELSAWDFGRLQEELEKLRNVDMSRFFDEHFREDVPAREDLEAEGGLIDREKGPILIKIRFPNINSWRRNEEVIRETVDAIEGVTVSVGGADEDQQGNV